MQQEAGVYSVAWDGGGGRGGWGGAPVSVQLQGLSRAIRKRCLTGRVAVCLLRAESRASSSSVVVEGTCLFTGERAVGRGHVSSGCSAQGGHGSAEGMAESSWSGCYRRMAIPSCFTSIDVHLATLFFACILDHSGHLGASEIARLRRLTTGASRPPPRRSHKARTLTLFPIHSWLFLLL